MPIIRKDLEHRKEENQKILDSLGEEPLNPTQIVEEFALMSVEIKGLIEETLMGDFR